MSKEPCAVLFVSCAFVLLGCSNDPESPQAKREWSIIQAAEAQNAAKPITQLELVGKEEFHLACLPWKGRRIWVLLNARATPFYKQMPLENFTLSEEDLQRVKDTGWASPTVLECLASHTSAGVVP